jgi:hypothetical protein
MEREQRMLRIQGYQTIKSKTETTFL